MKNARRTAFDLLLQQQTKGSFSNLLLEHNEAMEGFDARDRALIVTLVYGVIERKLTLDYQLQLWLQKPLKKLRPDVLCLLRLGAYQLLFLSKVPSSAAVNETVKLSKNICPYASGLINAVLRKIAAAGLQLPEEDDGPDSLSVRYSCPAWLIEQWKQDYGEENTRGILESSLQPLGVTVRVNTLKTTADALLLRLKEEGAEAETTDLPEALRLIKLPCALIALPSFKEGLFHVQDKASMLCARAVNAQKGDTVFDLCAAPGGKSFSIAETMENTGSVLSFDLHEKRVRLIAQGAKRLGLSCVAARQNDASVFDPSLGLADRVLCDVPCSGLGVLRQKPEVKYKDPASLRDLPQVQTKILSTASQYVKKGGRLVYSTCALSKRENEDVCAAFLKTHPDFAAVSPLPQLFEEPFVTLLPHVHGCDGFFIAAFEKEGAI